MLPITTRVLCSINKKKLQDSMPKKYSIDSTFTVGVNPSALAISRDGTRAYVTNSNNYLIPEKDSVTILDLEKSITKETIYHKSFNEPYRIALYNRDLNAYVCNSGGDSVSVLDLLTNQVILVIKGFDGPSGIVIAHSKSKAYINNFGYSQGSGSGNGNTISVLDIKTQQVTEYIPVARGPQAVALSPNEDELYVVCYVDGEPNTGVVVVVDTTTNRVKATIEGLFGPFSMAVSPCGEKGYVTNFGSNYFSPFGTTVAVLDLKKYLIEKHIEIGIQPSGIAISSDGRYAYVSSYNALYASPTDSKNLTPGEGTVKVIRLKDNQLVSPAISVGQTPSTVFLSPDNKRLFVCKYLQNTVSSVKV